jgi:hypothetical protein
MVSPLTRYTRHVFKSFAKRARIYAPIALLLVLVVFAGFSHNRGGFVSSEVQFADSSVHGLSIVPASCPSSPHYPLYAISTTTTTNAQGENVPPGAYILVGSECTPSTCPAGTVEIMPRTIPATCRSTCPSGTTLQPNGTCAPICTIAPREGYWQQQATGSYCSAYGYTRNGTQYCTNTVTTYQNVWVPASPGFPPGCTLTCPDGSTATRSLISSEGEGSITDFTCPAGATSTTTPVVDPTILLCRDGSVPVNGVCPINTTRCADGSLPINNQCPNSSLLCPDGSRPIAGRCPNQTCPEGTVVQSDGSCKPPDDTVCPPGMVQRIDGICVPPDQCTPGLICDPYDGNVYTQDSQCNATLSQRCANWCKAGACIQNPGPFGIVWDVRPRLVQKGSIIQILWRVKNVSSCVVTGTNGDRWTGINGVQASRPILVQTIYTLHCTPTENEPGRPWVDQNATVNIVPIFHEQ